MTPMTVGQLRTILEAMPADLEITVRASDDETDAFVCGCITGASIDYDHGDDTPFCAIEVDAHPPKDADNG